MSEGTTFLLKGLTYNDEVKLRRYNLKSASLPVLLFCNIGPCLQFTLVLVATPHFENTLDGDPCFSRHFFVNERKCSLGTRANLVLVGFAWDDFSPVHPCRGDFEHAAWLLGQEQRPTVYVVYLKY